jgi:hypothetical protein
MRVSYKEIIAVIQANDISMNDTELMLVDRQCQNVACGTTEHSRARAITACVNGVLIDGNRHQEQIMQPGYRNPRVS